MQPAGKRFSRYEILELLGSGGMGEVYRARDTRLERDVALKVLRHDKADAQEGGIARELRFEQEARAASALNHPNIVSIFDIGTEEEVSYIVSELIAGETLRHVLRTAPFPARKALDLAIQVVEGLAAAHNQGIVHRDLKPENIMLTQELRVKILDFGLAKQTAASPNMNETVTMLKTRSGVLLGTLDYMAPEQIRGDLVDARADQFAFGCILYEMLSGRKPFTRPTPAAVISAIVREPHPPLELALSYGLRQIVDRCLSKDPTNRYVRTSDLLTALISERDSKIDTSRFHPRIGQVISHYQILSQLGKGGLGVVYEAEDLTLKRKVALKFLRVGVSSSSSLEKRANTITEAQTVAALDHPNICTIYEVNEVAGECFIAMALVDGVTLDAKVRSGPISAEEARSIATQVLSGLQEAHGKGIIHRDIKSANIMLTSRGDVRVMDFGLAKLSSEADPESAPGLPVGTLSYMAPEQARGETVGPRADLWAVGVVLYEMLTGTLPFQGNSQVAVLYAILNDPPRPITQNKIPPTMQFILDRALAKNPAERYQSAAEMLADLEASRLVDTPSGISYSSSISTSSRLLPSIAVLPFSDLSAQRDQEYFCDGIAEELINGLAQIDGLRVMSRSSSFQFRGKSVDLAEVGAKLKVKTVLEGSLRLAGNRLRITAQLISVEDGYHIWSSRYDREMSDVFEIQDDISRSIVSALKLKLVDEQAPFRRYTENVRAYQLYLEGRYHWNKRVPSEVRKALDLFQQALAVDPNYALAYAGLADCLIVPGYYGLTKPAEVMPKGKAAALRALDLDPTLPEAHASLGMVAATYEFNWAEAEVAFKRALELNPNYAVAHMWYAFFVLAPMGRLAEAEKECRRALKLDPLNTSIQTVMGGTLYFMRRYKDAVLELKRALEIDPEFPVANYFLGSAYIALGMFERSLLPLSRTNEALGFSPNALGLFAYAQARSGLIDKARETLHQLEQFATQRYVPGYARVKALIELGETDRACDYLERDVEERASVIIWINEEPLMDEIRTHPRFTEIVTKMGLVPSVHKAIAN